jgi:hypothetical protein
MSEPHRWLESRHLARSEEGRRALAALKRLDAAARDAVVARGDELAVLSVGLAHAWLGAATRAYEELDRDEAAAWERSASELLGEDGSGRAATLAYLSFSPATLGRLPRDVHRAWVASARRLQARSQRLAAAFLEHVGRGACAHDAADPERVGAWAGGVERALAASRWRGELIAARLLEGAEVLFEALSPAAVAHWSALFVAVAQSGKAPRFVQPPAGLADLGARELDDVLGAAAAFAARDPNAGARLLGHLAGVAAKLPARATANLVAALRAAGPRANVTDAVALFGGAVHELAADDAELLLDRAHALAREFPAGLAAFLRTADRALEHGGRDGVDLWLTRGIELGKRNERAGVAHFHIETRTAHKILVQRTAAIAFDEVEAVMQRYAVMIARRPLHLAAGGGIWLRPPLAAPEDRLVRLPERVDLFETSEDNQLFYKLAVAHAAGRWVYGTYDFSFARLCERGVQLEQPPAGDDVVSFIDAFPNPLLAAGLFIVLDGARIDAALAREFRGLAGDLDRLGSLYAALPLPAADRAPEALIETLFLLSVGRVAPDALPGRLRGLATIARRALARLTRAQADAYDSAQLLVTLYRSLALAAAVAARDDDLSTFIEIGGATVIDPLEHLEGGRMSAESGDTAGTRGKDADVDVEGDVGDHEVTLQLSDADSPVPPGGIPLTPEQIRQLIEQGVELEISESHGEAQAALGLYITELLGKLPADAIERLRRMVDQGDELSIRAWLAAQRGKDFHFYDEWDYQIGDYRRRWCRLAEYEVEGDGGRYVNRVLGRVGDLIARIRREFLLMRPEQFRKVRGMEDGEDFDLNALVDAHADRRTRRAPSDRVYVARRREERDVATLFLIDMSASTDEPVGGAAADDAGRRVIDVTKETLVVMAAVLSEIGDAYSVYGFSGHGRDQVEYYQIKTFGERWGPTVRARIGGIEPKRSTRMGAALRHSARKLDAVSARARHLILLSDGFPQDYDYGEDRRSNVYGLRDTTVALQELESRGMKTFCITVDPAGHDYLGEMCPASRYAVIEDVEALPEELPRIYRSVTR